MRFVPLLAYAALASHSEEVDDDDGLYELRLLQVNSSNTTTPATTTGPSETSGNVTNVTNVTNEPSSGSGATTGEPSSGSGPTTGEPSQNATGFTPILFAKADEAVTKARAAALSNGTDTSEMKTLPIHIFPTLRKDVEFVCKLEDFCTSETATPPSETATPPTNTTGTAPRVLSDMPDMPKLRRVADMVCAAFSFTASLSTCISMDKDVLEKLYSNYNDLDARQRGCASAIDENYKKGTKSEEKPWQKKAPFSSAGGCLMMTDAPNENGACFVNKNVDLMTVDANDYPVTTACTKSVGKGKSRDFKTTVQVDIPKWRTLNDADLETLEIPATTKTEIQEAGAILKSAVILAVLVAESIPALKTTFTNGDFNVTSELGITAKTFSELSSTYAVKPFELSVEDMKKPENSEIGAAANEAAFEVTDNEDGSYTFVQSTATGMMVVCSVVMGLLGLIF